MVDKTFFEEKRPWSKIKDEVLQTYLPPYLAKVSFTKRPIIVADCFAGKGRFESGDLGSPLIIAEAVAKQIQNLGAPKIKVVCIERDFAGELRQNLPAEDWIQILEGDYESKMDFFINEYEARGQNLLLYVDPFGIKSIFFSHFEKISKKGFHSVELLLNLNAFGFLREACRLLKYKMTEKEEPAHYEEDVNAPERLDEIAGGRYWRDIVKNYYGRTINLAQAEEEFVAEYCNRLKNIFRYVVNIPIKDKLGHIPKYRIVFGTEHEDGLLLMVDNMNKRWGDFREEARNNQSFLFEFDFPDPSKTSACWNVENKIRDAIENEIELKDLLVSLVQDFGISFSTKDFKQYLKSMEDQGDIVVKRTPELTATGKKCRSWSHDNKDLSIKVLRRPEWQPSLL